MDFILLIIAYLIGAFPTAYIVGKLSKGIDIREYGSKNVGATNAQRVLGNKMGLLVFIIDIIKGGLIVFLFTIKVLPTEYFHILPPLSYGLAAVIGHDYPIYMRFKGGKGVASSCGVLLAFNPILFLVAITIFVITLCITKYVSLGSILASIFTLMFSIIYLVIDPSFLINFIILTILSILAIYRHRSNIVRLIKKEENKFQLLKKA